jgi:hypothetical protein
MSGTGVVVVTAGIILLTWEILAFVFKRKRALISTWFQKFGFRYPAAVLVIGMLLGHFWMYFPPTVDDEPVICPHCHQPLTLNVDDTTGEITATLQRPVLEVK